MSRGTKGLDQEYKPFQDLTDELMLKNSYGLANKKVSDLVMDPGNRTIPTLNFFRLSWTFSNISSRWPN